MTPFEKRLKAIPPRRIPSEWRNEILSAPRRPAFSLLLAKVEKLLWPHPLAWGALAACWLAIAVLCYSGPRGAELYAGDPAKGSINPERYAAYLRLRDNYLKTTTPEAGAFWIERQKL